MRDLTIAPIVEGHGEEQSIRLLLQNLWTFLGGTHVEVLKPIRRNRASLIKPDSVDLAHAVGLASLKLNQHQPPGVILILIDAEEDCRPGNVLGPALLRRAKAARADRDIACIVANTMYETWFVASAQTLSDFLHLENATPEDPEQRRLGKSWVKDHFKGIKYSETVDQPRMTARLDFALCRRRSPSFDKLCRELQHRLPQPPFVP